MLLSRGTQYTIQALIYLACQPRGQLLMVRDIAARLDIPPFYLAKLMQPVSRAGWLITARGRGGGIALAQGAEKLSLMDVLQLTDGNRVSKECLLGFKACDDDSACVLHCQWKPIKQELADGLGQHTLASLADSLSNAPASLPAWLFGKNGGNLNAKLG